MVATKYESASKKIKNDKKKNLKKNKPDSDSEEEIIIYEDDNSSDYETVSETSDSSFVPSAKELKSKKNKKQQEDDEETLGSEDTDDDEGFDRFEFRKTLSKIFPSKYMSKKVKYDDTKNKKSKKPTKKSSKSKKSKKEDPESEEDSESDEEPVKKSKKSIKIQKKSKKSKKEESESEEDSESDEEPVKKSKKPVKKSSSKSKKSKKEESESEEEDDDEESEEDDDEDDDNKINIVFTIGGDEDEWDDEYNDDEEDDEEDDEYNSDDEKMFMKENYTEIEMPKKPDEEESKTKKSKSKKEKKESKKSKKDNKSETDEENGANVESEYLELQELKKVLTEKLHKKPNSKILLNAIEECKDAIHTIIKDARKKNTKNYHKLVTSDRKKTNEMDYFKKKMSNKEQLQVMKDLKEINSHINIEKPYRLSLLESKIPSNFKAIALQKLNVLRSMEPGDSEYHKIKTWVDTFMKIPFGVHKALSIKMDDGIDKCNEFMNNAKQTLDNCVYGLDDAKMQIMQMIGQWVVNPSALGTAIAIKGPPGTGKTSLIKEGISKILGREFAFIALGGAGDSSFLEGHSYTYEGSSWGKILQILIDSKCMNPVIYFDELDKISDTPRGEEIVGILTHLTDTSQNSQYHDKYFSEIDFDLSKCLFIFSYNDENKVNPILKDRMYRIQTKGYDAKEKTIIARKYLLPKIREQVCFTEEEVIIPDDTIQYIVGNACLTNNEPGVRNLKRCLEIIHTKLNLFRLVKSDTNLFSKDMDLKVEFPFTVTRKHVDIFIKNEENQNQSLIAMYV
jgi:ATP-dependent Lon protease